MGIPTSYYNKIFNIYRINPISPSIANMFEVGVAQVVVSSRGIRGRLASGNINEASGSQPDKLGFGSGYKNKLFVASGTDIKVGDRIIEQSNSNNRYYVDYVNKFPGGLSDHHIECIVSSSDFMVAS